MGLYPKWKGGLFKKKIRYFSGEWAFFTDKI